MCEYLVERNGKKTEKRVFVVKSKVKKDFTMKEK